jgi:hypothetical protein
LTLKRTAATWINREKLLEPMWCQGRIARRVLDVAVTEVRLDGTRIMVIVGELVTAGMAQHVGMRLDAEVGSNGCPLDRAREARRRAAHRVSDTNTNGKAGFPADGGGARAFRAPLRGCVAGGRSLP